tara:strand:- start:27111 stop:27938 length:828 start_codon:yes stop_codon:yes gene_type:complete
MIDAHRSVLAACFLTISTAVVPASAQPDAASTPLAGPKVSERVTNTLIERDMQGRFRRIEGRPEVAALARIPIDPVRREDARRVIEDRAGALRAHLVEHIDLIKASTDASIAGNTEEVRRIQLDLYRLFEPAGERSPLLSPLEPVLSAEEFGEVKRVVNEYWDAWVAAEAGNGMMDAAASEALERRLAYELYQQELAYAYESTLRPFQQRLERIYTIVEPTDDQRAAIRAAVIKYIRDAGLTPTPDQREELARSIYDALDEPRRFRLFAAGLSAM